MQRTVRWFYLPVLMGLFTVLPAVRGQSPKAPAAGSADAAASAPATATSLPSIIKTDTYSVTTADIQRKILVTGELRAARSRDISAPMARNQFNASITFMVLEGTEVKKGERILEFDASSLLTRKSEVEMSLDEAKLRIEKTKADLEVQRSDLLIEGNNAEASLKVAQLYAKIEKSLLPANTFQKYQLDLEKATLALQKSRERLNNLIASMPSQVALAEVTRAQVEVLLKKIEGDIAFMQVDAPQDGIIIYGDNRANNRKFQVGDNVFPGQTVMTLPDLSSMQVVANIYDTELRFLSPNMVTDLSLDAVPGRTFRGKVVSITSVADKKGFASTHKVFRAVIDLEKVDLDIMKPGMTVKVEVPVSLASQAIAVPREFLGVDAVGRYYVLKSGDPKTTSTEIVQIGAFSDRMVQVTSGVSVGDRLLAVQKMQETKR